MAEVDYRPLVDAVREALGQLQGTYGLAILFRDWPGVLIVARQGSPLVLGVGDGEHFVASDASPLAGYTDKIVYLADHELAVLTAEKMRIFHRDSGHVDPRIETLELEAGDIDTGGYDHYMLKEIFEQPESIENAMRGRLDFDAATAKFGGLNLSPQQLRSMRRFVMTACGTSWHAALVGEYQIESLARLPVEVEYASELRYQQPAAGRPHAGLRHHAKRRDGRHAGRAAGDAAEGLSGAGHLQRGGQHDRAGVRRRRLPPRRTGDRRGLDQGLHFPVHGAGDAGTLLRPACGI